MLFHLFDFQQGFALYIWYFYRQKNEYRCTQNLICMMHTKSVLCFASELWEIVNSCCSILNFINTSSDLELLNM